MSDIKRKILAGTSQNVAAAFDFLMVKTTTGPLFVDIGGKIIQMAEGDWWKLEAKVGGFVVSNQSGVDVDCVFIAIEGEYQRAAVVGSVVVVKAATLTSTADVALGAGAQTLIKASSTNRREIIIKNLSGNASSIRIGENAAAAARGHELMPGESITLTTAAAVYAWNPGAGQSVSVLEVID